MSKKYRSEAFAAIHETMEALHDVGAINKQIMRKFDETCLSPVEDINPEQIKEIQEREYVSQPVYSGLSKRPKKGYSKLGAR